MDLIHVYLNVADVERSVEFYTSQLGFSESWSFVTSDGTTENRYVAADNGVEPQPSQTDGQTEFELGTAWDHVAVRVEDVDQAFDRINHHGIVREPQNQPEAGARSAFINDPDGHVV